MSSVHISTGNSKLGKAVACIDLPAVTTCRKDAPCIKDCYACKGRYRMPTHKAVKEENLAIWNHNHADYLMDICKFLNTGKYRYFRWHSCGDIVSIEYLHMMIGVAVAYPDVRFLAFTKKFELINEAGWIPENLNIVFSAWDNSFQIQNCYHYPVAFIRFKDVTRNPAFPADVKECPGHCSSCFLCWKMSWGQSVVFDQH